MTKRKRVDEVAVAEDSVARETGQVTPEGNDPVAQIAVTVDHLVIVREIEVTTPEVQTMSSVPVERPEQVADNGEGEGTIWSLMAQAGYMVW